MDVVLHLFYGVVAAVFVIVVFDLVVRTRRRWALWFLGVIARFRR
jgi:hypothetical protein